MRRVISLLCFFGLFFSILQGCGGGYQLDDCAGVPVAKFSFIKSNQTVTFTNNSTDASGYEWDFGDGGFSYEKNPVHTFQHGEFKVTLTAYCGGSSSVMTKKILI